MQECAGTAVIAFERMHFAEGVEFRGSPKQKPLEDVSVPTIWNQIEAAMAYTFRDICLREALNPTHLLKLP